MWLPTSSNSMPGTSCAIAASAPRPPISRRRYSARADSRRQTQSSEDARLWEMLADHAAIFRGVRIPVQVDEIEWQRLLPEHILDREIEGMVEALDAAALQFGRIRIEPRHVVARDERHLVAETLQREDVLEDRVGSGVLAGFGHRIVDNERPHPDAALGLQFRQFAVEAVRRERVLPALEELAVVDCLEALHAAAGDAGAGARAFKVNDFRGRLDDGAVAAQPYLEAEIRIFVIKRAVILVELADFAEQARLDHQGRAGHVVRVAHIA